MSKSTRPDIKKRNTCAWQHKWEADNKGNKVKAGNRSA